MAAVGLIVSIGGLIALSATYRPPTKPASYAIYPVLPDEAAIGSCARVPGEEVTWTPEWHWNMRPPLAITAEDREALLVARRHDWSRFTLFAFDAQDLSPIWGLGPCAGRITMTPGGAALAVQSHILLIDGNGYTTGAWWVRRWDNELVYDERAGVLRATVPWEFEERRHVWIEIDLERKVVTERLVDSSKVLEEVRTGEAPFYWTEGGARFVLYGQLYEFDYIPFAIRRRDSTDLSVVAASFPVGAVDDATMRSAP